MELHTNSRVSLDEVLANTVRAPLEVGFAVFACELIILPVPPPNIDMFSIWFPSRKQKIYWECPADQTGLVGAIGASPLVPPPKAKSFVKVSTILVCIIFIERLAKTYLPVPVFC